MSNLKNALDEYSKELCDLLPDDSELENIQVSKKHEKQIFKYFNKQDSTFFKSVPRRAASIAAVILLFSALVSGVRAIRDPVFKFVAKTFDNITSVTFFDSDKKTKFDFVAVTPAGIPDGFHLVHSKTDDDSFDCVYQTGNAENYIAYFQNIITPKLRLELNTKYSNAKHIYVGEYEGFCVQQLGNVTIVFFTEKYSFHISTNLSLHQAQDIAISVTLSENFDA